MAGEDSQRAANQVTEGTALEAVLIDYLRALEGSQQPDEQQIVEQHPELAAELRSFFCNRKEMEQFAKPLRSPGQSRSSSLKNGKIQYLGDYELLEEIGFGGMGVIFKARQTSLQRIVAVKMVLDGRLPSVEDRQRFRIEAEAAASLDHPSILPIFEVGEHEGRQYFSMKLVEGGSLSQRLASGPLPIRQTASLLITVARAVHFAHQRGILHRDLKPANILLDGASEPYITDFGLAKRVARDSDLTHSGAVLGTPSYMAPEQAAGKSRGVTTSTDVYGLGAILYTTLTGRAPFQAETVVQTLKNVLEREPDRPSSINRNVDCDLDTICLKCLQKEPSRRYASAEALARDLERYLAGEPVLARPINSWAKSWRWCRRNPVVATLAGVAIGLLVAIAVISTIAYARVDVQRQAAEKLTGEKADALAKIEKQATSLAYGLFELGAAEKAHGDSAKGMAILAKSFEAAAENDPLRISIRNILSAAEESVPICLPHDDTILAVAYSPDGTTVLTASQDNTARLWDARTGKPLGEPMKHDKAVTHVAYSPDGATVLTGSDDKTARLWDARSGKPLGESMKHGGYVNAVAYSPDGTTVLTGSTDNSARLWDARTGRPVGEAMKHDGSVNGLAYSPDGTTVLTGSQDNTARLWDSRTGKPLGEPMKHDKAVTHMAYSPDGANVLTVSDDQTARLWDARSGKPLEESIKHVGFVNAVAYSPDGTTVLTGSRNNTARLWESQTGKPLGEPMKHDNFVTHVAYSPDGANVLTGSEDHTARLWDARSGKPLGEPLKHNGMVVAIAFSPDGTTVLTGSEDHKARLWDARTNKSHWTMKHEGSVQEVAYSPDGATVLTGSDDATARLWDAHTGKPLGVPMKHDAAVRAVAFSHDGATALTLAMNGLRLWDARTGMPLGGTMKPDGRVFVAAFSPDAAIFLTGTSSSQVLLWDARTGKPLGEPMKHVNDEVIAVAYSPNGTTVLTGGDDNTARLWDARTGKPLGEPMKHDDEVRAVAYSPDGATVLTGSYDKTARLWDARTGKPLGEPMKHDDYVNAVAYSPNGATVLTSSYDATARLWDARTGKPLGEPMKHDHYVNAVAYSPNGATVLTGSDDKTARLWDARTGKPLGEPMKHDAEVNAVAYSPDGATVLTGSDDKTARLWAVAPLIPPRLILLVVATHSGMKMNDLGRIELLSTNELSETWKALEAEGADWLAEKGKSDYRRQLAWHRYESGEAEAREDWFAAEFHLRSLVASEPADSDLRRRLVHAKQSLVAQRASQLPPAPASSKPEADGSRTTPEGSGQKK